MESSENKVFPFGTLWNPLKEPYVSPHPTTTDLNHIYTVSDLNQLNQ